MDVQKLFSESSVNCGSGQCRIGVQKQPSADDARNFADAYEKDERGDRNQERQAAQDGDKQRSQAMPSPASLMESLFAGRMQEPAQVAAPQAPSATDMGEAMDKLVERILVAEPTQGAQEVRITLGEGMLKGAELSIMRHADGQLAVRVSCMDAASFQTAVSARQGLTEALEAHCERVLVVVDQGDAGGGNEGDSRQRSQGLQNMADEQARA